MKNILTFAFLLMSVLALSQNEEMGRTFIKSLLQDKDFAKSYAYFDESVKAKISETLLKDTEQQLESQLGKFKSIMEVNQEGNTYSYYSDFEKMKLDITISFNENKKIIGFFFVPHKEFKKENSLGKDFNIKSNEIELKGTLLIPEKNNQKKLVLFIHGSGPNDRDETLYENKPFKDIAESLYENGIASYRFDKRTYSNPESFNEKSTIDDEVTIDVLNIIDYFKKDPQYSQYEIVVIGHSLGGYVLPRIANQSNVVSKIILLAGNARPIQQLLVEQYDYLYQFNPTPEFENEIKKIKEQVAYLNSKDFNINTPKEKLPFNLPAYYWKSIVDYNPITEIKKIKIPILVLQGERDYQVTMQDFELWKKNLKSNKKSRFISYPKLNHLFMTGEGISQPQEYSVKNKVDFQVITDMVNFISEKN